VDTHGLVADRALLGRTSTADRVAQILRSRITEGYFPPGARLAEEEITEALGVSRNTLREAFRLLTHERLLAHELNRGVFVRVPDVADVKDLYRVRKYVECSALRTLREPPAGLPAVAAAVRQGRAALAEQDWQALGTADIQFHEAIAGLTGSGRIAELMRGVLAELRLVFHIMDNPRWFHEPYLTRNEEILAALTAGNGELAAQLLHQYLDDAEQQLLSAYVRPAPSSGPST
jgi:DNA-binding GntR family transcriptional regulator